MSRFEKTHCMAPYFIGDPPPAPMTVVDTKAMGDAIEALEVQNADQRIKDLWKAIDRLRHEAEVRVAVNHLAPRPAGIYAVQWFPGSAIAAAKWNEIRWLAQKPGLGHGHWEMPFGEPVPHWIGPRVDMREG